MKAPSNKPISDHIPKFSVLSSVINREEDSAIVFSNNEDEG